MQGLFVLYISLLRRHGGKWTTESGPKIAFYHVLSAVRPAHVKKKIESILEFAYSNLKKNLEGFMKHALKVSEAFRIVGNGPPRSSKPAQGKEKSFGALLTLFCVRSVRHQQL